MTTHTKQILFYLLLSGLLWGVGASVQAGEHEGLFELRTVKETDGLVTAEPRISQQELNKALIESEKLIHLRSDQLQAFMQENRITAQTSIVAAIMPGGLIYLAVRQSRLNNASEQLDDLQTDITNLQSDRLALHEEAPILVARFP